MEFVETFNEGLVRKCEGRLESAEVEDRINSEIEEVRPTLTLPGFRKGKVPSHVIRARFAAGMRGDLVEKIVAESFNRHLEEAGNKPAFQPAIHVDDQDGSGSAGPDQAEPMEIRIEYECLPSIPEVEFSDIELTRIALSDIDAMVEDRLANIALEIAEVEDTEDGYQAVNGDEVQVDARMFVGDEEIERYAASEIMLRSWDNPQAIQEQGFSLIGLKVGDELTVDREIPNPRTDEGGQVTAEQRILVTAIRKAVPAELTDEILTEKRGTGLEELKSDISNQLVEWCNAHSERIMHKELLDRLDEMLDFQLPPTLLARELANTRRALGEVEEPAMAGEAASEGDQAASDEDASARESGDEDAGAETAKTDASAEKVGSEGAGPEEAGDEDAAAGEDSGSSGTSDEEIEKIALRRLKLGLYLMEVAGRNDIAVSEAEILTRVQERYPREARQFGARELIAAQPALRDQVAGMEVERKVLRFIANMASVKVEDLTHDEASGRIREFDAEE